MSDLATSLVGMSRVRDQQARERLALLALFRDRRSGWAGLADEIESRGSALEVLRAAGRPGNGDRDALFEIEPPQDLDQLLAEVDVAVAAWAAEGIRITTLLDADYPGQLLTVHQRPPFLTYRGRIDPVDASGVAVVGTRHPSRLGLARAVDIATGLTQRGVTVVSGLAAGIDTAAHQAALDAGGRTVAVIGTGLRRVYPPENAAMQERLASDHLVLSQFFPDAAPSKVSFPMRNAVMSGYAAATVVIEAAWKSGARMQARLALEHGRPVFLHESLLEHDWARSYVTRGATVVSSAGELLTALERRLAVPAELAWS
jgi:DNA processing protein